MLDDLSIKRLAGVDPRLVAVIRAAHDRGPFDFIVTEGLRSLERQRQLVKQKKSWTLKSKHLVGQAVDVAVMERGIPIWDFAVYRELWEWQIRPVAVAQDVKITWGGDWKVRDGVHFELA